MATFGERLRSLRQKREYRQKDIADRLGISESAQATMNRDDVNRHKMHWLNWRKYSR